MLRIKGLRNEACDYEMRNAVIPGMKTKEIYLGNFSMACKHDLHIIDQGKRILVNVLPICIEETQLRYFVHMVCDFGSMAHLPLGVLLG